MVFFCFLLVLNCETKQGISNLKVNYKEDNTALSVSFIANNTEDLSIHLKDNSTAILGSFYSDKKTKTFTPIIPFTNGETYAIKKNKSIVLSFAIKSKVKTEAPQLLNIYPTVNEVPENLLKMYFEFSKPMQEVGSTLDFIQVFNKTTNKKVDIFLELETELWNKSHTILTLWLDPGRIKKDLIPNKEKGLPIVKGHEYEIKINALFRDANGSNLDKDYLKTFTVIEADKNKPSIDNWNVITSIATNHDIKIEFNEPLDAILLQETIKIYDVSNNVIDAKMMLSNNQKSIELKHTNGLKGGKYKVRIESRLEDLAGNNLNRLFDEDLQSNKPKDTSAIKEISFIIK